jgi:hypothetical protein
VFKIPTLIIAAAYKSGRSVTALPIKIPPALALQTAILSGEEYFSEIKYSVQAIKSFQVLGFVNLYPPLCHASPFSPPPLVCEIA